jgi:hypothetical protein
MQFILIVRSVGNWRTLAMQLIRISTEVPISDQAWLCFLRHR